MIIYNTFYKSQIDNAESLKLTNDELKEYEAGLKRVNALIQKNNLFQEASLTSMTEMSDSIKSLGAGLGKNNKLFDYLTKQVINILCFMLIKIPFIKI